MVKGYNKVKGMDNHSSIKDLNDVVRFQLHHQLNYVAKEFLNIIEDLESDGYKFAEEKRNRIRKRIFDSTNDAKRNIEMTINKFDISFKK